MDAVVEWGKAHEDEIKMGVTDAAIAGSAVLAGASLGILCQISANMGQESWM